MDEPPASQPVVTDQLILGTPARCTKCAYDLKGLPDDAPCPECGTMPSRVVHIPRYCISCGYLLIGLPITGPCPECGTPVALSLREPWLASAGREYLESLHKGLTMVLAGILALAVLGLTLIPVMIVISFRAPTLGPFVQLAGTAIGLLVTALLYVGYWHATEPDPAHQANEVSSSARNVVRVAVLVQAGISIVQMVVEVISLTGGTAGAALLEIAGMVLGVVGSVMWAVQYFAMMRYVRWLASRVPDGLIIRRTQRYMWLLPVLTIVGSLCLMIGPLIAMALYWRLLRRLHKHIQSILSSGDPAMLPYM